MKRNKVRNWIYAILKLLPLFILPVFMIFSNRHEATNYEVELSQNLVVDFNQKISLNNPYYSFNIGGQSFTQVDDTSLYYTTTTGSQFEIGKRFNIEPYHKCIITFDACYDVAPTSSTITQIIEITYSIGGGIYPTSIYNSYNNQVLNEQMHRFQFLYINDSGYNFVYSACRVSKYGASKLFVDHFQLFDLTQMFGSGNEPSIDEFNALYPDVYYDYTLSRKELLKDIITTIYDNTDIGSQLVYALYSPINDYFNFKNYFGLNGVYDFMQLNMFNGNAPLPFFIAFNVIAYNLFIDLLLLVYSAFVFIIDFAFKCLDKFYGRSEK